MAMGSGLEEAGEGEGGEEGQSQGKALQERRWPQNQ